MNIQQMIARSTFCLLGLIGLALFTSPVTAQVFDNVINIPPDPNIGDFADVGGDGLTTQVNISDGVVTFLDINPFIQILAGG